MKRKYLFLSLFIFIFLIACSPDKNIKNNTENIEFIVDATQLSHSYQLKNPHAEFISKCEDLQTNENIKLLISLGTMESSGLKIKEITKADNKLNIYVDSLFVPDKLELAVPQAMVSLDRSLFDKSLDSYSFEIINHNGKLLDINLDMTDAISKIESHFKLAANVSPEINLIKKDDLLIWDIKYPATFDKSKPDLPLVKFSTQINAMDGSIIDSNKTLISNPIDDGLIIDIETDNYILYKKFPESAVEDKTREELWIYDINKDKSELLFTSDYTINSTQFSPDLSSISLIEGKEESSNLYIIPKKTKKAYKVLLAEGFSPDLSLWKDSNKLTLLQRLDNKTKICKYDINEEQQYDCLETSNLIHNISYNDGNYLFTEKIDKSLNKKIYSTKDFKSSQFVANGFNPEFINKNTFIFIEDEVNSDTNILNIYDLDRKEILYSLEGYIQNFQILSDDSISFIEKKKNYNHYILSKLSLEDISKNKKIEPEFISSTISDRVFYNKNHNLFYLNINIPFEHKYKNLTYLVDSIEDIN